MSMLEKLCDAKNTFEGKALAVFMSLVMVLSFINFSSFADAAENGTSPDAPEAQADDPSSEPAETPAPESAPSAGSEAATPAETPEASEPPAQSEATVPPASEPEPDLPTAEPGVAVVGVELDHAYLVVADQEIALPLTSFKTSLNKDLVFEVKPDGGYQIDKVVAKSKADGTERPLEPQADGSYRLVASEVSSNLVIKPVVALAPELDGAVDDAGGPSAKPAEGELADGSDSGLEAPKSEADGNAATPFGLDNTLGVEAIGVPTELTVDPATLKLNVGASSKLKAIVEPVGSNGKVVWTSSDPSVAKVTDDGTVKALSGGTTTITARSVANPALANVSVVTVTESRTVKFKTNTGEGEIKSLATTSEVGSTIIMPELPDGAVNNWPANRVFVGWSVDQRAVTSGGKDHYTNPVFAPGSSYVVPSGKGNIELYAIYSAQNIGADFYLRIDGQFPAEPQGHSNSGYVKIGWVENAIKVGKFVTDTTGAMVSSNLAATPNDAMIQKACAGNPKLSFDPETQTVIWYVIKNEGTWHVDGAIRDKASVVLAYSPNIPAGETLSGTFPNTKAYAAGASVKVESGKADWRAGYTFKEWNTEPDGSGTSYQGGYSITLNESKTLYAIWSPKDGTNYRIQDYLQNADGSWPDEPSHAISASGKTGATVYADTTKSYTGYTFDAGNDKNVLTGKVAGDGSLVLKRYYAINTCKVTYLPGDHGAFDAVTYEARFDTATPEFQGEKDENDKPLGKQGYNFAGWAPSVSATIQAETTEYVAQWTKMPVINVLVKSEDQTVVYDGTEHVVSVNSENLIYEGLPEGFEISNLSASGRGTEIGQYDITIDGEAIILNGNGEDVADQFFIARDKNTLTVTQAPLTITAPTKEKTYDGTPLTFDLNDIIAGKSLVEGLVDGQQLVGIDLFGSITDAGTVESSVLQAIITSGSENVTRNYDITYKSGTLTVKEFEGEIVATTEGGEYPYDGDSHGATVSVSSLPEGYTLVTASSNASATDVTEEPVVAKVDTLRIINKAGVDVTDKLNIVKKEEGTIVVKPAKLYVKTRTASKPYDGTPLTAAGEMTGLVNNETAAFTTTGTATEVNAPEGTPNTYTIDWNGSAKKSNYTVEEDLGTLTVSECAEKIVVTTVGGEFLYNGEPHGATVTVEGLPAGYWVETASSSASATDVTTDPVAATADKLVIRNASGADVTDKLNIEKVDGQIKVTPAPLTVRIVGNSALETYTGSVLAVDDFTTETAFEGKATITLKNGVAAHAEGVDVGKYPMGLTPDSFDVASRNYEVTLEVVDGFLEISPLDTLKVTAENVVKRYDGASYGVEAIPSDKDGRTSIKYYNEATDAFDLDKSPVFKDAGTYTVRFQATNPNYSNVAEGSATVTIEKRTVTLESASASRQYNGEALVVPTVKVGGDGFVAGEEPAYEVTGSATNVADTRDENNEFAYTFPEGVNADNYEVTTLFGTLAITPAPLLVTVTGKHASVPYDGGLHEVDGFGDDAAGKATIALKEGAAAHAEGTDAGEYFMGLTPDSFDVSSSNYTVTLNVVDGYLRIDPAGEMSVSASNVAKTYDGNRYGVKAEASVEGATIRYRDPATGEYTLKESPTFLDWTDGPQTVGFQATHPNYQTAYGTATVTIDKRTVVLRSGDAEREYDGTALVKHEASVVDGAFVRGQEPEVAYYGSATNVADTHDGNNGFSYEFPEGVNADNYQVTTLFGTLTITPAPLLVTVTGAFDNVTFDGKPHTVKGFTVGDEAAGKATIALKDGERAYAEGVAAGRYPMNLTAEQFSVQSDNYRVMLNVVDGYLNIDKAGTLSVDAQPVVKTYDGSGYGVEAKASVDRAQIRYYNAETDAYDLTESPKYADAGTYIVKFQAALDNYNTAEGATTVTINPRAVTLTSADAAKPYDGTPLVAEDVIVAGGFVSGEGAAYSDFASLTDAGTLLNTFDYRLNEGTKASNYEVTKNCGTLKVEKAPLVVRIQGAVKSVAYNGALQAVDGYKVLDDVGDKASIELAGNAAAHAEGVDVGEYPMGLSPESFSVTSRNYEVTLEVADGKLAISPSGALTVSAEPVSAMYDGKRHGVEPTASLPGAKTSYWSAESGDYTLDACPTYLDVTDGPQAVKFKATLPNHQDAYGDTTVEVTVRPVSVTSADGEKVYDGNPLTNATVTVGGFGFVNGEEPAFAVTGSQTDAGSAPNAFAYAFPGGVREGNYAITKNEGTLTVRKAPLTVNVVGNHDTVTFDGRSHQVDGFADDAAGRATIKLKDGVLAHAEGTDAGTYPMGLTADSFDVASRNYDVTLAVTDGYLAINPAGVMTVAADNVSKRYDGKRVGVQATASVEGAEVRYFNADTGAFDLEESPTFLDATEGAAVVRFQATHPNYATVEGSATVTIDKRSVVLTSDDASKTYDGEALSAERVTVSGEGFADGEGAVYTDFASIVDAGSVPNAFAYRLEEGTHAGNYDVTVVPGVLSVAKAPLAITVMGNQAAAVYDGANHLAEGYVVDGADGKAEVVLRDGVLARAEGTDAGTYPMGLAADSFEVWSNNYDVTLTVVDGSLSVAPAKLLISANDASKRYGQTDPALTASVAGLVGGDAFSGSYNVTRVEGESVGTYAITVEDAVSGDPNYVVEVAPGSFTIVPADAVSLVVGGGTKVYDGTPLVPTGFTPSGLADGDYVEVVYSGSQTDAGSSASGLASYVIRNAAGEDVTANYENVNVVPGDLTVTPAAAMIVVADAAKVAGAADPTFTGTVTGLVDEGDLGRVAFVRSNVDEAPGTYVDALTASFTGNPNYTVTVVPGTFTITAAPVVPPAPVTPATPTPGTPVPPVTPGVTPEGTPPAAAAVIEVLEDAVTPLAGPQEETIGDNENPLAGFNRVNCWVHYYLILGIIVTVIYGAGVLVRRINFTRKLKGFENDVLGIEDEQAAAPFAAPFATDGRED